MERYVLAPDSFKESLSAPQAVRAMALGVRDADPGAQLTRIPMADGGEGFAEILAESLGARRIEVPVHDALGRPIVGALYMDGSTAIIDVATAVGLGLIARPERDIMASESTGVGELVLSALDHGARELIVGLGGSATNDGGAGMLRALGARLLDAAGRELAGRPAQLSALARVDTSGLDPRLGGLSVVAACDVRSPLLGPAGASAVFGPQKGATPDLVARLDALLGTLSRLSGSRGKRVAELSGSGAAGGLGWALMCFLGARMRPGVDVVVEAARLADDLEDATALFTGEGSVDAQSAAGKTVAGLAGLARGKGVPVVVFAGRVQPGAAALHEVGVTRLERITPVGTPLDQALAQGAGFLRQAVARVVADRSWDRREAGGL